MKAFASDKAVRLGAEGLVLWAEIHNEGDVNVAVLKCHGGDHSKLGSFSITNTAGLNMCIQLHTYTRKLSTIPQSQVIHLFLFGLNECLERRGETFCLTGSSVEAPLGGVPPP